MQSTRRLLLRVLLLCCLSKDRRGISRPAARIRVTASARSFVAFLEVAIFRTIPDILLGVCVLLIRVLAAKIQRPPSHRVQASEAIMHRLLRAALLRV